MKLVINTSYGRFGLSKEFYEYYNIPYHRAFGGYVANEKWTGNVRKDARLIKYIERFGSKAASGPYSYLIIVEIPKGTRYRVDEYDGYEGIETEDHIEWDIAD